VRSHLFSTDADYAPQQAGYWHEAISRYFGHLDAHCDAPDAFEAQMQAYEVGVLRVFTISSSGNDIERSPRHLDDHGSDYYKLLLQLEGRSEIVQRDDRVALLSTDWSLYDPRQPYVIQSPGPYRHLVVQIPRASLQGLPIPNLHTSQIANPQMQGLFRLLASFLESLSVQLPHLPEACAAPLSETLIGLLSSTLASLRHSQGDHQGLPAVLRARVKQHVQSCLTDPGLSLDQIAQQMRCSKRYLHRIFEEEGITLDRYIWQSRLERCKAELEARHDGPEQAGGTISEIAFRWGFNSTAHFSRVFKSRYGLTPRECASRALQHGASPQHSTQHH